MLKIVKVKKENVVVTLNLHCWIPGKQRFQMSCLFWWFSNGKSCRWKWLYQVSCLHWRRLNSYEVMCERYVEKNIKLHSCLRIKKKVVVLKLQSYSRSLSQDRIYFIRLEKICDKFAMEMAGPKYFLYKGINTISNLYPLL